MGGVGELAFELVANFFSDGKAAGADGGADGGDEVLGAGAEVAAEGSNASLDDAGEVPRQPAWKAATAWVRVSATRTGTQSAVRMPRRRLGSRV